MATFTMKMIQGVFESKFSVQVRGMRKDKFEERRLCLALAMLSLYESRLQRSGAWGDSYLGLRPRLG